MQSKRKRWVRRVLVGTAVAVVLGGGLTVYLLRRPPAVWREAQQILAQTTPEQRAEQAEAVMHRLTKLVDAYDAPQAAPGPTQRIGPVDPEQATEQEQAKTKPSDKPVDQTHEVRLSNEELVAVVGETFNEWTGQRGFVVPSGITQPAVLADDGRLAIVFEVSTPSWSQVFSGFIDLKFRPDGMAAGRVDELTAGSLPVSVVAFGEMLSKQLPASESQLADQIGEWVSQLEGFEFRPVLEMEHRRRARVVGMKVENDAVTLQMRVQDHETYKRHNELMDRGALAVTDQLDPRVTGGAVADVPTTTD